MKNRFFCLLTLSILLVSCSKDKDCSYSESNITASAAEITYIQDYLTNNAITATQHSSGFFYQIDNVGTGSPASLCSTVTVNYTGSLLSNGSVFDSQNGINLALGQVIVGWQKGLPLIKSGGTITLYIPPSLGYRSTDVVQNGVVVIPANSYLKFVIQLLDVQ